MKKILINPEKSLLGLKAYKNYFTYNDDRGELNIWLQPSLICNEHYWDKNLSFQIQQGFIDPGAPPRGNHYHPHDKALDFFHLEQGNMLLALESTDGLVQELHYVLPRTVMIFPAHVAHAVHNVGKDVLRFTTFKTWNHAIAALTTAYKILVADNDIEGAKQGAMAFDDKGNYGFDHDQRHLLPVMQRSQTD